MGLRDRARVPGEARLDARRSSATRSSRSRPSPRSGARRRAATRFGAITDPLKEEVKRQGLWAAHLPPDMGGARLRPGQARPDARDPRADACTRPSIFGNNAPDSGNAELIAVGGTDEQKEQWMQPLLDGKLRSCFSMTEPGAGADPTLLTTTAVRDGDEWVINGHKWFSSNASIADFLHRDGARPATPTTQPYQSFSMIIVPTDTPGREHPARRADDGRARPPHRRARRPRRDPLRGRAGARSRTSSAAKPASGRASRWPRSASARAASTTPCAGSGQSRRAFDMLCERALTRYTHGSLLAEKQMIQDWSPRATPRCRRPACSRCTRRGRWTSCTPPASTTATPASRSA